MFWHLLLMPAIVVPPTMVWVFTPVDLLDRHGGLGAAKALWAP